jgi:hypothetical protein
LGRRRKADILQEKLDEAERKISALERILISLTRADKISYNIGRHRFLLDTIEFHGADPDDLRLKGYSEGLSIDWDAEIYEDEVPEEFGGGTCKRARMVGEVWIDFDMYKELQRLRAESVRLEDDESSLEATQWNTVHTS